MACQTSLQLKSLGVNVFVAFIPHKFRCILQSESHKYFGIYPVTIFCFDLFLLFNNTYLTTNFLPFLMTIPFVLALALRPSRV